ncbi:including n-acetylases of ribosomal protein [Lojkania enalia]|uniref:Including n-acetylases of ribosomal protein n=1 Tax=Lojkania enalia TaxID=147567 RepID=A0A9P4KC92_9PLEO|nr:including n-acetylases of ribosomal protein [Didymosphaeria enalia]
MPDPNLFISTPRLYIANFLPELDAHCDFILSLYNMPETQKAIKSIGVVLSGREAARKRLMEADDQDETGYGNYIVMLKPEDPCLDPPNVPFSDKREQFQKIGTVSMKLRKHAEAATVPDVGFGLMKEFWGKGYATEATKAVMQFMETEKGVREVFGFCSPMNEESKKTLKRLGFEERATMELKGLGPNTLTGMVWALPWMHEDLAVYNLR